MSRNGHLVFQFVLSFMGTWAAEAQVPNPLEFNTAADGTYNAFAEGTYDANWSVAYGDSLQPTSAFIPARVIGRCDAIWEDSPFSNANWIGYDIDAGCSHISLGCTDLYFQRQVNLPPTDPCGFPIEEAYCLAMDFFADNCVFEVSVNGVSNYQYAGSDYPYHFAGYQAAATVNACEGWHAGPNILRVQVKSCPTAAGLLAQANLGLLQPYYFPVYLDTSICKGQSLWGYTTSGTYVDTLQGNGGCDSIRSLLLQVNDVYFSSKDVHICPGEVYGFNGNALAVSGHYTDTLASASGCDSILDLWLSVSPTDFLGPDTVLCTGDAFYLESPAENTRWFDHGSGKSKEIPSSGIYWAAMVDDHGCELLDTIAVRLGARYFIPHAFSPNGDGINDLFLPYFNDQDFDHYLFRVFDRWGNLAFFTQNPSTGWDGSYRGKAGALGVYTYYITMNTPVCNQTVKGDVTLLR